MKCSVQQSKEVKGYGKTTSNVLGHLKRKVLQSIQHDLAQQNRDMKDR